MSALQFKRDLARFVDLCYARLDLLYKRVYAHVRRSILDGSPVTGAPGQPIQYGDLYRSWEDVGGGYEIAFVTRLVYARIIEDNRRGATLRSMYGGFHSVKLTRAGFIRIVDHELAIVKRAIPDNASFSGWRDPVTGRFV